MKFEWRTGTNPRWVHIMVLAWVCCWTGGQLFAQDTTELTAKVVKMDLKIEVEVVGVFVADDKDEIAMEPSKYRGDLIVTKILPEGSDVKEGDVLMEFDTDKLDEALEEAENEATDAEVELHKATAELESAKIDSSSTQSQLQKELEFLKTELEAAKQKQEMDLAEKEKEISDQQRSLSDLQVDFNQLTELYQERELHTATENILIEREKEKIDDKKESIETLKKQLEFFRKFELAKAEQEKDLEIKKKQAEIEKEKITLEAAVAEKQSVVDKAQRKLETASRKVDGLKKDREQLKVISPRSGILFYKTTGNDSPVGFNFGGGNEDELRVGGRVKTHGILLTVATMDNLSVKMQVKEYDIQHMKTGLPMTVRPDAFPAMQLKGTLTKVDQIASRTDVFSNARRFTVRGKCTVETGQLKSGMNCRVIVHSDVVPDAIQVPIVAVIEQGGEYYCNVKNRSGYEKRQVQIGLSNDQNVQITEGLRTGEIVFLNDPAGK